MVFHFRLRPQMKNAFSVGLYSQVSEDVRTPLETWFVIGSSRDIMRQVAFVRLFVCFHVNRINTLRAKLSGAVYCYRSCLWRAGGVCVFVGLLPR